MSDVNGDVVDGASVEGEPSKVCLAARPSGRWCPGLTACHLITVPVFGQDEYTRAHRGEFIIL